MEATEGGGIGLRGGMRDHVNPVRNKSASGERWPVSVTPPARVERAMQKPIPAEQFRGVITRTNAKGNSSNLHSPNR
jgi:hypothetical protein